MSDFARAFVRRARVAQLAGVGVRDVERFERGQAIITAKRSAIDSVLAADRRNADAVPREETIAAILEITGGVS